MDESEADLSLCETYYDDDSTHNFGDDNEININWRGWKRFEHVKQTYDSARDRPQILPLVELAAKTIAYHIPFEIVENVRPPVPEQLHLRITYWSFPESEDEIRLYACLANGNSIEYDKAENIIKNYGVKNLLQIGFYISATVRDMVSHTMTSFEVSLTFDRRRIVSCTCTCASSSVMCCHIVAVCLSRILYSNRTELRPPVSDSLQKLKKDQLRKFAQYLITKLPQQILPTAQHILDDLLNKDSEINHSPGAPDPTSGPAAFEKTSWCLDLLPVLEGIRKALVKLKTVQPEIMPPAETVSQNQQQLPTEFGSFLRPLRGKEPEGMWNLISIIKHLMKKGDENSVVLLKTLTEEIMDCDYVIYWWFASKTKTRNPNYNNNFLIIASNMNTSSTKNQVANFAAQSMQGSSHMCDEIVHLWRLTVLNPKLSAKNKEDFYGLLENWHLKTMRTIFEKFREEDNILNDLDKHPGFKSALKACLMDWNDYPIAGLTDSTANSFKLFLESNLNGSSSKLSKLRSCLRGKSKENKLNNQVDDAEPKKGDQKEQGETKLTVHSQNAPKDSPSGDSLDDELNFLYKYDITINNYLGLDCKYPHPVNPHQFTYTLSTKKDDDPIETMFARAEALYAHGQDRYAIDLVVYLANYILDNPPKIDVELNPPAPPQSNSASSATSSTGASGTRTSSGPSSNGSGNCPNGTPSTSSTGSNSSSAAASAADVATNKESKENKESKVKKAKTRNSLINANMFASEIYTKITFLCNVLISNQVRLDLAFRIGLLGLELARPPAIIKPLEVKLYYQEQELIPLLKRIPLNKAEMNLLRERGRQIRDGKLIARGSLLPLSLASFIFDAFVLSKSEQQKSGMIVKHRLPVDDYIGFECAVAAIGLKCPFIEKDHQFLWESIRRQRFEFIQNVICHYKNKENRLVRIMEKLIDKEGSGPHHCDQDRKGAHFKHKHSYHYPKLLSGAAATTETAEQISFADELIEYERKYAKCNCTLKDLNSKLITASSPNYSHIQCLLQQPKNKFKDKNKLSQSVGKSVGHMNVQFMQGLGRALLNRAGCNISDNFDGNNLGRPLVKPNKNLHYCGFLCLLYALGLNNQLIKWLQRTYSILVSFVLKEASEIGYPAIKCLITTWKGYLTPNEAISISTQAVSRPNDTHLLNAKAKLALSVLSESQALRLIDIRLALQLCKDQSEDMLFQALEEIEKSYKNGGLSSDILFETAQNWYNIYVEYSTKDPSKLNLNSKKKLMQQTNGQSDRCAAQASPIYPPFAGLDYGAGLNGYCGPLANNQQAFNRLHPHLIMPPPPPPAAFNFPPPPAIYYPHPAAFIYPPNQVNGLPGHFQIPPPPPPNFNNLAAMNFNLHMLPPPQQMFAAKNFQISNGLHQSATLPNQPFGCGKAQAHLTNGSRYPKNANQAPMLPNLFGHLQHPGNQQPISHYQASVQLINQIKQKAYHKAYSLGIMALDALPRKVADDRSAATKYDPNPLYYDEILWLAEITTKLSPVAHQEFLTYVSRQIPSPIILYEIMIIFAKVIDPLPQNHQSKQSFHKFVQNTQYAFEQCIRHKLAHSVDQEELEILLEKAKVVYSKLPNGSDILMKKMETLKLTCGEKDRQNLERILNSKIKRNFDSSHHSNHSNHSNHPNHPNHPNHSNHHHHSTNGIQPSPT